MNLDLLCLFMFLFIYLSIYLFLILTVFNYVCVSAFEQGHLDPWRSKSALIIIIIIQRRLVNPLPVYNTAYINLKI